LHVEKNYLHRLTPLFGIVSLSSVLAKDIIKSNFLPVLVTLAADDIPNIRMNVAKAIEGMMPHVKGSGDLEEKLKGLLKTLATDKDMDVKFYARRA
jgi:serine/threonine-protein phosphatase 2A regulatory subunit A